MRAQQKFGLNHVLLSQLALLIKPLETKMAAPVLGIERGHVTCEYRKNKPSMTKQFKTYPIIMKRVRVFMKKFETETDSMEEFYFKTEDVTQISTCRKATVEANVDANYQTSYHR